MQPYHGWQNLPLHHHGWDTIPVLLLTSVLIGHCLCQSKPQCLLPRHCHWLPPGKGGHLVPCPIPPAWTGGHWMDTLGSHPSTLWPPKTGSLLCSPGDATVGTAAHCTSAKSMGPGKGGLCQAWQVLARGTPGQTDGGRLETKMPSLCAPFSLSLHLMGWSYCRPACGGIYSIRFINENEHRC